MLEWHRRGRLELWVGLVLAFGELAAYAILIWVIPDGIDWGSDTPVRPRWVPLGIGLLGALLLFHWFNREFVAAGATWVAHTSGWVRTHDLVAVKVEHGSTARIVLVDGDARTIRVPLELLQQNRDLWDLVHGGIMHCYLQRPVDVDTNADAALQITQDARYHQLRLQRRAGVRLGDPTALVGRPRRRLFPGRRYRRGRRV